MSTPHNQDVLADIIACSIWKPATVAQSPEVKLADWSIRELPNGNRHFVGYNVGHYEGRVSSRIEAFDAETKRGITQSGRVYELLGEPGYNGDAEYVWGYWASVNNAQHAIDVTDKVLAEINAAGSSAT